MILERLNVQNESEIDLSSVAALIGEPARALMLTALMDGLALPAGELSELAGISPQTASAHLTKLLEGGLLAVESHGRHRYFSLAGAEVAQALEALMVIAPLHSSKRKLPDPATCYARTCYDHLAGSLGVMLCQSLLERGWLEQNRLELHLTNLGKNKLEGLGLEVKKTGRACLDWTERRHHLAGPLGKALTAHLLERGWLIRSSGRSLRISEAGKKGLALEFGLRL